MRLKGEAELAEYMDQRPDTPRPRVGPLRAKDAFMDWGFVVFVGTLLFFAALHQWPPDGRRWQRQELTIREEEERIRRRRAAAEARHPRIQ